MDILEEEAYETLRSKGIELARGRENYVANTHQVAGYYKSSLDKLYSVIKRHRELKPEDVRGERLKELKELTGYTQGSAHGLYWTAKNVLALEPYMRGTSKRTVNPAQLSIAEPAGDVERPEKPVKMPMEKEDHSQETVEAERTVIETVMEEAAESAEWVKELKGVCEVLKAAEFSTTYVQRVVLQNLINRGAIAEDLLPRSYERASLPRSAMYITPTEIALELGWRHPSGAGDAKRVNILLAMKQYQTSHGGRWIPTAKGKPLSDMQVISVKGKTDVHHLKWSPEIIPILQKTRLDYNDLIR